MKKAFSIVETMATIVLLGIVFTTIPMLLSRAGEVVDDSLGGEALYHASALITRIASMPFNSVVVDLNKSARIIDLNITDPNVSSAKCGLDGLRKGSRDINATKMRLCESGVTTLDPFSAKATNQTAINHFQGYTEDLDERGFRLSVDLKYIKDWDLWESSATESNFVLITVTALHKDDNRIIGVLNYVASNIGAIE